MLVQTVTKSDAKGWMGKAAWQLSREVQWGDLWPSWYGNSRRKMLVFDPDSKEAKEKNKAAADERQAAEQGEIDAALKAYGFDKKE